LPAGIVTTSVPEPAPVAVDENCTRLGLLLVSVTAKSDVCAEMMAKDPWTSKFWPTDTFWIPILGPLTIAVTACCTDGVLYPEGVLMLMVAVPAVLPGWNCVVVVLLPPKMLTGELAIVPTAVLLEVTFTLSARLLATPCWVKIPLFGSIITDVTVRLVGVLFVAVVKLLPFPAVPMMNPDCARVTVPVALSNPGAEAV